MSRYIVTKRFEMSFDDGNYYRIPEGTVFNAIPEEHDWVRLENESGLVVHMQGDNLFWKDEAASLGKDIDAYIAFDNAPSVREHLKEL